MRNKGALIDMEKSNYLNPDYADIETAERLSKEATEQIASQINMETEKVNHPTHYNQYDVEVLEMMQRIWGVKEVISFCKLNAFKYRMRAGHKDDVGIDLDKEQFYLDYIRHLDDGNKTVTAPSH